MSAGELYVCVIIGSCLLEVQLEQGADDWGDAGGGAQAVGDPGTRRGRLQRSQQWHACRQSLVSPIKTIGSSSYACSESKPDIYLLAGQL